MKNTDGKKEYKRKRNLSATPQRGRRKRLLRRMLLISFFLLTVFLIIPMLLSSFTTAPFAYAAQSVGLFDGEEVEQRDLPSGGVTACRNISYGEIYENSTLDILYANVKNAPTFIFVHGGGNLSGSKSDGSFASLLESVRLAGYNTISVDYSLMPGGTFPVPVCQLSEAIGYLAEHANEYGLNMENYVLMGQSSGAATVIQFATALENEDYATMLNLSVLSSCPRPRAVILDDASLDTDRMHWQMRLVVGNYIAGRTVLTSEESSRYDAALHFVKGMPPCFIIGSYSYRRDANRIQTRLSDLGIDCRLYDPYALYHKKMRHCFINSADENAIGKNALEQMLIFINGYSN